MLLDAPRETRLARGEMDRISEATGIPRETLRNIQRGDCWGWLEPATADTAARTGLGQ